MTDVAGIIKLRPLVDRASASEGEEAAARSSHGRCRCCSTSVSRKHTTRAAIRFEAAEGQDIRAVFDVTQYADDKAVRLPASTCVRTCAGATLQVT